ncbi:hypothetical protein HMI56_003445, partial [Coelomomyces lativittatus]
FIPTLTHLMADLHFRVLFVSVSFAVCILAEHHLALHHPQPNFVGIIDFALHPATSILSIYHQLHDTAKFHFGDVPTLELVGHTDFTFAYIPVHFNYILTEVLKNSIRATMEEHRRRSSSFLVTSTPPPPIQVTLVNSENEVVMCIRDQGGGIPPHQVEHVFDYAYSTASSQNHPSIMNEDRLHPDYSSSPFDVFAGQVSFFSFFFSFSWIVEWVFLNLVLRRDMEKRLLDSFIL